MLPLSLLVQRDPFGTSRMGCVQSSAGCNRCPACKFKVSVTDLHASIDTTPTIIEEYSDVVLKYRTPYFRASAKVTVPPIRRAGRWAVGWIQACTHMEFFNTYGNMGTSSWEIPSLKTGEYKMISDSDGVLYPWYGATTEVAVVEGPTHSPLKVELSMNDNFYPSVTWDTPVSSGNFPHLTRITRDQGFTTWLAVMNLDSGEVRPLRTIKWRMRLQIEVEPLEDAGKRARLVGTGKQEQPYILTNNQPIPETALRKPNANDAQMLVWRPQKGPPVVVVPPKAQR
ncbi:PREDICTED: protein FAM78B-like [Branchiostoma belcheri]|uniref:Protein FAM78B-like n=1 Tax=Branchiostoma belcheri TaxID=7741 RepID=A0A6P4YAL8_BRABE|nr:PREDICTED: protein FAM78B-like [Branchiostoma belcheri]